MLEVDVLWSNGKKERVRWQHAPDGDAVAKAVQDMRGEVIRIGIDGIVMEEGERRIPNGFGYIPMPPKP